MIGALVGLKKIPQMMVDKIIKFDCTKTKKGVKRIEYFSTRVNLLKNIKKIIEYMPKDNLKVVYSAE